MAIDLERVARARFKAALGSEDFSVDPVDIAEARAAALDVIEQLRDHFAKRDLDGVAGELDAIGSAMELQP